MTNETKLKMKAIGLVVFMCSPVVSVSGAPEFVERDDIVPCIVELEQKRICQIEIDGIKSELWYRKPGAEKPEPKFEFLRGTGFFVSTQENTLFLVTASHVAKDLLLSADIIFAGEGGDSVRQPLSEFCRNGQNIPWEIHPEADVAVLPLSPKSEFLQKYFKKHFLPMRFITDRKDPPSRDTTLTVLGFPLGLGTDHAFAPLTRQSNPASSLLKLARADNKAKSTFFLLEDPTVGGYSGAPVIDMSVGRIGPATWRGKGTKLVGMIHGTLSDNTGGKLTAVIPSYFIIETIELAKKNLSKK